MNLDYTTSTVEIAGRRFPAVNVICPPRGPDDPDPDYERRFYGPGVPTVGDHAGEQRQSVLIPCENGVLIGVEWFEPDPDSLEIWLFSRVCQLDRYPGQEPPIWVPISVALSGGCLISTRDMSVQATRWDGAEPEWAVELIDRVSRLPFVQPDGPAVRVINLTESELMDARA